MATATTATTLTTATKTASKTMIALLGLALGGGCVPLLGTVHYDDLDALVLDATGKHVYEPLAEHDVQRLEHKVQYARRGDLERIIEESVHILCSSADPDAADAANSAEC